MHSTVAILANGSLDLSISKDQLTSFSHLIIADGGLIACHSLGLIPDLIIGDFDSCPSDLLNLYPNVEKISYPRLKDFSDLELALQIALDRGFQKAVVFGALGGRIDHSIYNLQLLLKFPFLDSLQNGNEEVFLIKKKKNLTCTLGQTLSLFSLFEPAEGVFTSGCRWELQNATLESNFMSLSNEAFLSEVIIECQKGILFCCLQKENPT